MLNRSDYFFLTAAVLTLLFSIILWIIGEQKSAIFVGTWTPTLLGFGIYLKLKHVRRPEL